MGLPRRLVVIIVSFRGVVVSHGHGRLLLGRGDMVRPLLLYGGDGMLGWGQGRGGMEGTYLMTTTTIIVVVRCRCRSFSGGCQTLLIATSPLATWPLLPM